MAKTSYSKRQKTRKQVKPLGIRSGDQVLVIAGEGKSNTPRKVLSVLPRTGKVLVEGVNVMKDSQKKQNANGDNINTQDFIEKPCPIHASNVMLMDPKTSTPTRIKIVREAGTAPRRIAAKSGQEI